MARISDWEDELEGPQTDTEHRKASGQGQSSVGTFSSLPHAKSLGTLGVSEA